MIIQATEIEGKVAEKLLAEMTDEESFQSMIKEKKKDNEKKRITQARTDSLALKITTTIHDDEGNVRNEKITGGEFVTKDYSLLNMILRQHYMAEEYVTSFRSHTLKLRIKGACRDFMTAMKSLDCISGVDTSQKMCQGEILKRGVKGTVMIADDTTVFDGMLVDQEHKFSSESEKNEVLENRLRVLSDIFAEIQENIIHPPVFQGTAEKNVDQGYITRLLKAGFAPEKKNDWLRMVREGERISIRWRYNTMDRISVRFEHIPSLEILRDLRKYLTEITLRASRDNIEIDVKKGFQISEKFEFSHTNDLFTATYDLAEKKLKVEKTFSLSDLRGISGKMERSMKAMEEYIECKET